MLTVLGRQFHASQRLIQLRAGRNANEVIEEEATFGERIADAVARFGGSWKFIISFAIVLIVYSSLNILLKGRAWDPYPFILLNLFLSMLACNPGAGDHDEPEPAGQERPAAQRTRF